MYNLLLAFGAFYTGIIMLSGSGIFSVFPKEWAGKVPFHNWESLALFAIILFGLGNAIVSIYGFKKRDTRLFILTIVMGALFFFCTMMQIILLKEWYLATLEFLLFSLIQILLGSLGLVTKKT